MIIKLSPQVTKNNKIDQLEVQNDTLIVNGESFDFSSLPEGGKLPADAVDCEYIIGEVTRVENNIHCEIYFPIGLRAPHESCFPEPIHVTENGIVNLPPYDAGEE